MEKSQFLPRNMQGSLRDLPPDEPGAAVERRYESGSQESGSPGSGCTEGCAAGSWGLHDYPLAMVYVPCQTYRALYDPATALSRGTLFTELDLPLGGASGAYSTEGCACRVERRRV